MAEPDLTSEPRRRRDAPATPINRMPTGSPFFERIVPILLIAMGVVATALILFAAAVLLGFIPFQ
jgi:hypothetical protein